MVQILISDGARKKLKNIGINMRVSEEAYREALKKAGEILMREQQELRSCVLNETDADEPIIVENK